MRKEILLNRTITPAIEPNRISHILYSSIDMELRCDDIKEYYEIYLTQEEIIAPLSVASN